MLVYNTIIAPHFDYCSTILMISNDKDATTAKQGYASYFEGKKENTN
jgi:hypothetical protein